MRSSNQHVFAQVPHADIPRSAFNRSHGYKTTFNEGYLVPVFVDEALPGDTFNCRMSVFARMATPIAPLMDNLVCDVHFFAVPNRLIWDNWKKFNGEQVNPGDSTDYLVPQVVCPGGGGAAIGSIWDYFGLPTGINAISANALPFRAYNLIYNEWYRDQNLISSLVVQKDNGVDTYSNYSVRRRAKRHDYFTSCLPWPQKGTSVTLPLGTTAPVERVSGAVYPWKFYQANSNTPLGITGISSDVNSEMSPLSTLDPRGGLVANLSTATAATINALRQAFQLQRLYERDARGGTRYTEIIRAHFGVTSPDARQQRPEFLGGGSVPVNFTPVPQTSASGGATPQGNNAAFATIAGSGIGFTKSFTEHCYILGIASVRADLTYQQGMNRLWSRSTRWDFYWPALAHLGEQAVLNKEIYTQGTSADNNVFGYQERFAEYRYKPSQVTADMRSTSANTIDLWHLSQKFTSLPVLNQTFIEENAPMSRVLAVSTAPHFIFDSYFSLKCVRPIPTYSVPGLIDLL